MGISMAPLRLSRQKRKAVWTQGGGCCLAILSTGPRSLLPGPQPPAAVTGPPGQSSAVERNAMTGEFFLNSWFAPAILQGLEDSRVPLDRDLCSNTGFLNLALLTLGTQ